MAWRLYLSDRPIRRVDILAGKPALLAAWLRPDRVAYYDLQTGTKIDERTLEQVNAPRGSDAWRAFIAALPAPNKTYPPYVRGVGCVLYNSTNGGLRLIHEDDDQLIFETAGREAPLEIERGTEIAALAFDPVKGAIAFIGLDGRLHVFHQAARVGVFEIGLTVQEDVQPSVCLAQGGEAFYTTDGRRLVAIDRAGQVVKAVDIHYTVGALTCSPDGRYVAVGDIETNVIRIYNGADLSATHQRFAVDLLAEARRAQLIPGATMATAALGSMAITSKGVLAFTLGGAVCVTNLSRMKALPSGKSKQASSTKR